MPPFGPTYKSITICAQTEQRHYKLHNLLQYCASVQYNPYFHHSLKSTILSFIPDEFLQCEDSWRTQPLSTRPVESLKVGKVYQFFSSIQDSKGLSMAAFTLLILLNFQLWLDDDKANFTGFSLQNIESLGNMPHFQQILF